MSIVLQTRASFPKKKAVGVNNIAEKLLKALPWRVVQAIRRFKGQPSKICTTEHTGQVAQWVSGATGKLVNQCTLFTQSGNR